METISDPCKNQASSSRARQVASELTHGTWRGILPRLGLWAVVGAASFQAAYAHKATAYLIVLYLFALLQLARAPSGRWAFYSGLGLGILVAALRLAFFWRIFSFGAIALWLVFAVWLGLFALLARLAIQKSLPRCWGLAFAPFLWCGLEFFRSELYYLRFSWLSPGYAFGLAPLDVPFKYTGSYGIGFVLCAIACAASWAWQKSKIAAAGVLLLGATLLHFAFLGGMAVSTVSRPLRVAGVQLEFPAEPEVVMRLTDLARRQPDADLLVLSEYTFNTPLPGSITNWCRKHQRYVIVGAEDPAPNGNFYDSAFVISPAGEIVFRQAKCVPIQFFRDGLPAREQRLWESPWGKIGICICYDLSYARVTDRLVALGAEALIVPTMDIIDWGRAQHELHGRVAPVRAAEYGIPIFRVASSGISQAVDSTGRLLASAPFPGDAAVLSATLQLRGPGHLPWDRILAPISVVLTVLLCPWFVFSRWNTAKMRQAGDPQTPLEPQTQ